MRMKYSVSWIIAWMIFYAFIGIFAACSKKEIVLEEGGAYSELGTAAFVADDTVREFRNAADAFRQWASRNPAVVADSKFLTNLENEVYRWLTPPAEPDEPMVIYFTLKDAWAITKSPTDMVSFEAQADILEALTVQLLTATR